MFLKALPNHIIWIISTVSTPVRPKETNFNQQLGYVNFIELSQGYLSPDSIFLEIFHLKDKFLPMKITSHSFIGTKYSRMD